MKILRNFINIVFTLNLLIIITKFSNLVDNIIGLIPKLLNKIEIKVNYFIISFVVMILLTVFSKLSVYIPVVTSIVEEAIKLIFLFVNFNCGMSYILTMNFYEFSCYMVTSINFGVVPSYYILTRLVVFGVHFLTFAVLNEGVKLYKQTKKIRPLVLLYLSAVAIHMLWNVYAGNHVYYYIYLLMN